MSASVYDQNPPGGAIPDQAQENLLMHWVFAVAWLAASIFIVTPLTIDALKHDEDVRLLALAFPAVGLGLLLWALRRSLRIQKFGSSVLRVKGGNAMPGGDLAAIIHVEHSLPGGEPIRLRLRCLRRHPNRKGTAESVLWQQSQNLDVISGNLGGTDIPVRFHLPTDLPTTDGMDGRGDIVWRLEACGQSGLVNYFARFEVPVGVAAVPETTPEMPESAAVQRDAGPDPRSKLRERGIECQPLAGGGWHIHLAGGRRKLTPVMVMALLFTGIAVVLFLAPVPGLERIITVALGSVLLLPGAILDYIVIFNWLVSQDVKVQPGSLVMERRALFLHWGRTFKASEISAITCQKDGESSDNSGVAIFHGIQLKTRDGQCAWLASNISQGDYAAWLTYEINAALGRLPES